MLDQVRWMQCYQKFRAKSMLEIVLNLKFFQLFQIMQCSKTFLIKLQTMWQHQFLRTRFWMLLTENSKGLQAELALFMSMFQLFNLFMKSRLNAFLKRLLFILQTFKQQRTQLNSVQQCFHTTQQINLLGLKFQTQTLLKFKMELFHSNKMGLLKLLQNVLLMRVSHTLSGLKKSTNQHHQSLQQTKMFLFKLAKKWFWMLLHSVKIMTHIRLKLRMKI